jgi:chemotaxis protein methyltransferase CheR
MAEDLDTKEWLLLMSFSDKEFGKYKQLIYNDFGIYLNCAKKDTLKTKLCKLMTRNGINSYDEYYNALVTDTDNRYITEFINEITINKTDFFRENNHFDFISKKIKFILENNQRIIRNREIRVWSAGCSSGEEAYTLAFILKECLADEIKIKILATDICNKVLTVASKGVYPAKIKSEIDNYYLSKYFDRGDNNYKVAGNIKDLVTLRQFNLMSAFPFSNTFDMIFCRNVMIYFDLKVQQHLLDKFYNTITSGGLLFLGHSESLINKKHRYQYIQPTIYMK